MRPAAPVRLGRGGEPPGLISPWRLPLLLSPTSSSSWVDVRPPRRHRRPLRLHRRRPDGEYLVPRASSRHGDHRQEDEGSPAPTSSSSAPTAARTLDTAATEEPSFTVEAAAPSARLQSPTPPSARPEARSPGQQVFRMASDGEGPPTPSQSNGSVSRMEVDDTREDQTCHPNDETEPLPESLCQKSVHALSTKIPMSDFARRQNPGPGPAPHAASSST